MQPKVSREEFINVWNRHGSAILVAKHLEVSERSVLNRRRRIEKDTNQPLINFDDRTKKYSQFQPIQTSLNKVELGGCRTGPSSTSGSTSTSKTFRWCRCTSPPRARWSSAMAR